MKKSTTKYNLASHLNGILRRNEFPEELLLLAKVGNFIIISGGSDDRIEFRGAIIDEEGCYDGGTIQFSRNGIPTNKCDDEDCPYYRKWKQQAIKNGDIIEIDVYWCGSCQNKELDADTYEKLGKPTWYYDFGPHNDKVATFDIFDDQSGKKEYYCRAAVIDLDELWPQ